MIEDIMCSKVFIHTLKCIFLFAKFEFLCLFALIELHLVQL